MKAIKFEATTCPSCAAIVDLGINVRGHGEPKPGHIAVCMSCGEILVFAEDMKLRSADLNDALRIKPETMQEILECQKAVREGNPHNRHKQ